MEYLPQRSSDCATNSQNNAEVKQKKKKRKSNKKMTISVNENIGYQNMLDPALPPTNLQINRRVKEGRNKSSKLNTSSPMIDRASAPYQWHFPTQNMIPYSNFHPVTPIPLLRNYTGIQHSMSNFPTPSTSRNSHKIPTNNLIKENPSAIIKSGDHKLAASCSITTFNNKKNSKKNRWTPPLQNEKIEEMIIENTQLSKNVFEVTIASFHFDIQAIQNPSCGFFIRKRSACKYINLNSFGTNTTVVFSSNIILQGLDTSFKILNDKMGRMALDNSSDMNKTSDCVTPEGSLAKSQSKKRKGSKQKHSHSIKTNESADSGAEKKCRKPRRIRFEKKSKNQEFQSYPDYISEKEKEDGLNNGTLIKGLIRINQRNRNDAYVTNIIKGDTDYLIKSLIDQNRALDGDEVILKLKPENEWDEGRKTAVIVYISKQIHSRTTVGKLLPLPKNHALRENFAAFYPRDKRFPVVYIPNISCPQGFTSNPESFCKNLYVAKITEWTNTEFAKGLIIENVGLSGDLKVENLAILKTCGLDHEPFSNSLLTGLPKADYLEDIWFEGREDLRKECIFTIDPITARDLDDAVSCKTLPDGNLEIGVHIADVSFFLKEGTELDKQVQWKATTIYMVDNVHHMLPVELCMNCSLLPTKDKLSFSVFWKMSPDGDILSTRFARTVMNSCVQLAYEHAQAIIDDPENFDRTKFPKIANGYNIDDIKDVVLKLYNISKKLREKRFVNGALRINQIKLSFNIDPQTGLPMGYFIQEQIEANRLIEEFMLLANISVAEKIMESFPDIAFLRLHEPPKESMMVELKRGLESVGIHVDITSSKSIQASLLKYNSDDESGRIRAIVLNHLFAKPMTRARYFCSSIEKDESSYRHYALNIPLYTHFTSPIRRYADIMVHRLLEASLGTVEAPNWEPSFVAEVASRCNILKYNAKKAQEESTKLYLNLFIAKNGPFTMDAAVVDVRERSFDVIALQCGEIVRVYLKDIVNAKCTVEEIPVVDLTPTPEVKEYQKKYWRVKLVYPPNKNHSSIEFIVELFTLVKIELKRCSKTQKLQAKLLRPTL